MARKEKKTAEFTGRDKTRDRAGVKAKRRDARKAKSKRRTFERGEWQ